VDNTVGEDWDNVELSLAAGAPKSFIQQLSEPYYTRRPEVPLPQGYMLTPQTHSATLIGESSLQGNVIDPSGASVAGAVVRVTDNEGNQIAQTETDNDGTYSFSKLLSGSYKVEFSKDGFQPSTFAGVSVRSDQTAVVNVTLRIGSASTSIEVTAAAGAELQSMNATVGGNVAGGIIGGNLYALPRVTRQTTNFAMFSPEAAAKSSIIVAQGNVLGDLFEYKLKDRVTIRKNQSALVPIVQTDISAEKVSLWNSDMSISRPLRALWLTNSSSLVLDGGSFSVLDGGAFGGEGIVEAIQPGERRLISYAIDLAVQVEARSGMEPGKFTRTRIARGVMIRTSEEHQLMTYTIRNEDTSARTVVIEHPVHPEWKLASNLHPDEQTDSAYRFRVNVEPKHTSTFTAEETRTNDVQYRLSSLDDTTLELFIHQGTVNPEIEAALRQILAQKTAVAHLEADLRAKQQESDDIFKDQGRVRENMKALKGTPEERSLTERYTKELGDQETQLATLKQQIADLDVTF
jgi:5-hydroxyisourate hydrolase-like protein (transthyretin family)